MTEEEIINNSNNDDQIERPPNDTQNVIPSLGRVQNDFFSLSNENNEEDPNSNRCFEANLDGIYANISKMINLEKKKIQKEKDYIQKTTKEFNDYKAQELVKLEKEKVMLRERYKLSRQVREHDIIDLNIGGTHFISTKRSTLLKVKNILY
ncbi:MAG: hypothetical protein MJ252_11480 [archaeon]|nr:hypothetical protein [archaeon]